MEEIREQRNNDNIVLTLLSVIRNNIILILVIILLATSIGIGYAYIRKPNYTASISARLSVQVAGSDKGVQKENATQNYIKTVIDFCDEGVVLDRANWYYLSWQKEKANKTLEEFLTAENIEAIKYDEIENPRVSKEAEAIFADHITTQANTKNNITNIVFDIKYTDNSKTDAEEKVQILMAAFAKEINLSDAENNHIYFEKLTMQVESKGLVGTQIDMSNTMIVMASIVIGVILAALILYAKNILDNSVRTKEELEMLTGAQVVGMINDMEDK